VKSDSQSGVSLLELLITISIIMIFASAAMPITKMVSKRTREIELRQELRMVRTAIDLFKLEWNRDGDVLVGTLCIKNKVTCKEVSGVTGYPKSLDNLLKVELTGDQAAVKGSTIRRYLRKMPVDPMTTKTDWKLRCYADPSDATSWCGEDIYDLSSVSVDTALDGSKYKDW
jgi:general secretion pathway protein G